MSYIHTAQINFYHLLLCLPPVMTASGSTKCTDILPHSVVFPPIEMLSYMFTSLDLFSSAAPLTLSRANARTVLKTERKRYIVHVQWWYKPLVFCLTCGHTKENSFTEAVQHTQSCAPSFQKTSWVACISSGTGQLWEWGPEPPFPNLCNERINTNPKDDVHTQRDTETCVHMSTQQRLR